LLALLAPDHPRASQPETWQVLFDLYRVTDQQAAYDERATEFACRFQRSPPQWRPFFEPEAPSPARADTAASLKTRGSPPASSGESPAMDWSCPPVLDLPGVRVLQQTLTRLPQPWRLSWADLARLESEALPALAQLVAQWAGQRVRLRMAGIEGLERILDSRTACGDRSADPRWWTLRLDWLRAMRRSDEFELVALDYCVTYEVSPPAWDPPLCEVRLIAGAGETRADTGFEAFESRVSTLSLGDVADLSGFGVSVYTPPVMGELSGALLGDIAEELARLEARLQGADLLVISCSRLERLDFEAAGALLNWVSARQEEARTVHLVDVHRLVAAFLGAMGLASQACITLRRD
jgi:ABC-type transporter Mla MlaB component